MCGGGGGGGGGEESFKKLSNFNYTITGILVQLCQLASTSGSDNIATSATIVYIVTRAFH